MALYKVQQMAQVWHEVMVEAVDEDDAKEIGCAMLMNGDGLEVMDSWEWQDEFWSEKQ